MPSADTIAEFPVARLDSEWDSEGVMYRERWAGGGSTGFVIHAEPLPIIRVTFSFTAPGVFSAWCTDQFPFFGVVIIDGAAPSQVTGYRYDSAESAYQAYFSALQFHTAADVRLGWFVPLRIEDLSSGASTPPSQAMLCIGCEYGFDHPAGDWVILQSNRLGYAGFWNRGRVWEQDATGAFASGLFELAAS